MKISLHRLGIAAILLAAAQAATAAPPFAGPRVVGRLAPKDLTEASGLAASRLQPDLLWAVNDSGNGPVLFLLGSDGSERGRAEVSGVGNRDWEDLASFTLDGKAYLMIADTGDNLGFHSVCTLAVVEEPPPPAKGAELRVVLPVSWTLRFEYEDGPRDCEAVAVDAKEGKVLLVTKREPVPRLYELPLKPERSEILVARYAGPVILAENRRDIDSVRGSQPFAWQPTAMDVASDGSMAVVSTYRLALVYARKPGESWAKTLAKPPARLAPHGLSGCEDIALSMDGMHAYLTSEGAGSPIKQYDRETTR